MVYHQFIVFRKRRIICRRRIGRYSLAFVIFCGIFAFSTLLLTAATCRSNAVTLEEVNTVIIKDQDRLTLILLSRQIEQAVVVCLRCIIGVNIAVQHQSAYLQVIGSSNRDGIKW